MRSWGLLTEPKNSYFLSLSKSCLCFFLTYISPVTPCIFCFFLIDIVLIFEDRIP